MHRLYKRLPEACFRKGFWQAVYAAQLRLGKSEIYEVHLRPHSHGILTFYIKDACVSYTQTYMYVVFKVQSLAYIT